MYVNNTTKKCSKQYPYIIRVRNERRWNRVYILYEVMYFFFLKSKSSSFPNKILLPTLLKVLMKQYFSVLSIIIYHSFFLCFTVRGGTRYIVILYNGKICVFCEKFNAHKNSIPNQCLFITNTDFILLT